MSEYGTYKSKITLMNANLRPELELTTWKPELVDFLVEQGIIREALKDGETIRISIAEAGPETWITEFDK